MDVKCPVCEKLFPPSLITYHAEHCLYTSFTEKSNSSNKRSISEILEYESDVATATASYPRKRQHYGHSSTAPSTTASVAYYPKEPSEYRRVVSRQGSCGGGGGGGSNSVGCIGSSSSVGASSLAPKEGSSWGGSGSVPLKASSSASIGSSSATGWPTRKPGSSQDYRSAPRVPLRRDSSSNVTPPQRTYIRAPPSGHPPACLRVPSLSSSAASSGPSPTVPSAPVTHNYPKKGSCSSAPVAPVTVQRVRPTRPRPAQPPPAAAAAPAATVASSAAADGAVPTTNASVAKKTELTVPPRRLDRLYDLVRPCALSEVVGHEAVLGPRGALRASLEAATFRNTIVWGPAGCGKSTLGHILWRRCRQSGGSWRCNFLSGSAVATPELLQSLAAALAPVQGSKRCKTLLFVDELHCLAEKVQVLLASSMDREDITLIGTCHLQPATCISSSLVSRCEVYRLMRLLPVDLEVVVRRALGRVRCRVLNREAQGAEETPEQTRELDLKMIDGYYSTKKTVEDSDEALQSKASKGASGFENNDLRGGDSSSRVEVKNENVKIEPPVQPDNVQSTKNVFAKAAVEAPVAVAKKPPNDTGIEDMSDEEDESILDVLTKDLDQIGTEFNKIDHEMDAFRDEDPRRRKHVLKDLNDLDCVSDDDLPLDQRHTVDLESIDSSESEEQMEDEELSYTSVGMTTGAVTCLASRCSGDARVTLDVIQSLLEQAKERAAAVRAEHVRARRDLPAPSSRERGQRTHIGPKLVKGAERRQAIRRDAGTRVANYGSSSSNRLERRVVYEKASALTTDDISSDEDNEVINARPESNGGTNGSRAKVDDLDNVSDVSDNSVHLLDGDDSNATADNVNTSKQGPNTNKSLAVKAMDSDDVLSEALSEEDALDYEEIDMGEDAVSDVECANTENPRPEPMALDDESVSGTSFGNVVIVNGRLSTMLFTKGREAIAPNKISKSNLKLNKRPIKNKLLYSNADLMKNAIISSSTQSSSPPKATLGLLEEIGDDLDDIPAPETQAEEDVTETVHEGRPPSRQPGLVYAMITMRHVKQALQHRGVGTPFEQVQLSAALMASISSGHCEDALHCLARLLRACQEPADVASLLLQAAASHVGIGDSHCLSAAVACVEAVKLLPPPHSHAALANTAVLLARASKDPSPALALQAAIEQLDHSAGPPPRRRPLTLKVEANATDLSLASSLAEDSIALTSYGGAH